MTQKELAKKIGCSGPWLCRVLSLSAVGSDELYANLHAETGISMKLLFSGPKEKLKKKVSLYLRGQRAKSLEGGK